MLMYSNNGSVDFVWLFSPIPEQADGIRLITYSGKAGLLHVTCSH